MFSIVLFFYFFAEDLFRMNTKTINCVILPFTQQQKTTQKKSQGNTIHGLVDLILPSGAGGYSKTVFNNAIILKLVTIQCYLQKYLQKLRI